MTKDEAAEMIKDDMRLHHDYLSGTYRKALNVAIEVLKTEAIPIAWIEQYGAKNWFDFGTQYNAITEMLKAWREERGRWQG